MNPPSRPRARTGLHLPPHVPARTVVGQTTYTALRIYSTPYATGTKITTLLHDTTYRTALAWQNTAYNQPPHPSFFIGSGMATPPRPTVSVP